MKYAFYIHNQGVSVFIEKKRKAVLIESYLWSHFNEINQFLMQVPKRAHAYVILDLVEEDISLEPFPKLYLWERNTVRDSHVARQKAEGADYVHTQWTGQTQTSDQGRLEEFMLTSSITSPPHLVNFMNLLEESEIMLTGLFSASFLLADYFKSELSAAFELSKSDLNKPFFLVSRQSEHSYRQTFFFNGAVRISRLIELDKKAGDNEGFQASLIHETKLAKNYIYNQNIIDNEDEISYVFVDASEERLTGLKNRGIEENLIPEHKPNGSECFFKTLLLTDDNVSQASSDYYTDRALAGFVLKTQPSSFYETPYLQRIRNLLLGYRSLVGVNTLVVFGLLGYLVISAVDWQVTQNKIERLEQSIVQHEQEKVRLQEAVALQVDAEEIKASVEFSEAILKLKTDRTIGFDIKPITQVIAKHKNVQMTAIDWTQQGKFDTEEYEIVLRGLVFPFEDYYSQPVQWVDAFMAELGALSMVREVELLQEPLNRNLKQALNVVRNNQDVPIEVLPFQLKVRVSHESGK